MTFGAQIVVHVLYDNDESAKVAGHLTHSYATAKISSANWFKSKEAFMGLIIKSFEALYDEMKIDARRNDSENEAVHEGASGPASETKG